MEDFFFEEGEWVESALNPSVFGIVVGQSNWGQFTTVQMAGTLEIKSFFSVTLRPFEPDEDDESDEAETDSNVIDFTKEKALRADTPTKGVA